MLKKISAILFSLFFCSVINVSAAENINGDIDGIEFDIETDNKEIKSLNSAPLPALFSDTEWLGVADTPNFTISSNTYAPLFDNKAGVTSSSISFNSTWSFRVTFDRAINLQYARIASSRVKSSGNTGTTGVISYEFYNGSTLVGKRIQHPEVTQQGEVKIFTLPIVMVADSVVISVTNPTLNYRGQLYEIEFYPENDYLYESVEKVTAIAEVEKINLSYTNPDSLYLTKNILKINNELVYEGEPKSNHTFLNLKENTMYKVEIGTVYYDGVIVWTTLDVKTKEKEPPKPPGDVTEFEVNFLNEVIELTFKKTTDADYVRIYKNGKLIADKHTLNYFADKEYEIGEKYTYKIVAVNDAGNSPGLSKTLEIPSKEISNLRAVSTANDIELFWSLPVYMDFEMVSIYRKETGNIMKRAMSLMSMSNNDDSYDHIFMTNGTYFKDMTVAADTNYEYKLTTVNKENEETKGVIVQVKTKGVAIGGTELEPVDPKDKKGDYLVSWKTPTTGKIKLMIGGKEYKIIDAASLKHTIPGKDLVFNVFGEPDVQLIPIESETGREIGVPVKPGNEGFDVNVELEANGLLKAGVALLGVIGSFLLLGLAFRVVPKLTAIIKSSFLARKQKSEMQIGRRTGE